MAITLVPLDVRGEDARALASFTARNGFPFAPGTRHSVPQAARLLDAGALDGPDHVLWWIEDEEAGRVGILALEGADGDAPALSLHIDRIHRGKGFGNDALRVLVRTVFTQFPHARRLQGRASEDFRTVRQALARNGFVKEAHFRDAWPVEPGEAARATVVYTVLRRDWAQGLTTPVRFDDLGY